jgi:uncharacterized protein YbjT (DUF2867 family)
MKILVVGASQGTGALAVKAALARGHAVTAFARSPQKLLFDHPQLTRVAGDFHDKESVAAAVKGHDAVLITASANTLKAFKENPNYFSQGTGYVIEAMKASGAKRLVVLSALGTGESRRVNGWLLNALVVDGILKRPFADHERQEAMTMQSGLEWVIARPTRLTNGPALGKFQKKVEIEKVPSAISRADVAAFMVEAADTDAWVNKAVQLGG